MRARPLLLGVVTGAGAGVALHALAPGAPWARALDEHVLAPAGQLFLRLLFMLVVPLIFAALVVGISEIPLGRLGRLGLRSLGFTVLASGIAVVLGLVLVNLLRPGHGGGALADALAEAAARGADRELPRAGFALTPQGFVQALIPDNPIAAAARGDMLGFIVFSLVFGVALAATRTDAAARLREAVAGLYDVTMTCIDGVLRLAPVGVGALLCSMALRSGAGLFVQLAAYVGTVVLALALHLFGVYALLLRSIAGVSPRWFFRKSKLAMLTAFATSSSSATLPTALKVAEEELRLPRDVARFVLTAGASMNQNGTALFEGVTVLFLAQVAGVELGVGQQLVILLICILAGIGTAGVPAGSLPVVAMILAMFGIPPEGLGLILGVDRLLDMCRTTLNVTGDLVLAGCVAGRDWGRSSKTE